MEALLWVGAALALLYFFARIASRNQPNINCGRCNNSGARALTLATFCETCGGQLEKASRCRCGNFTLPSNRHCPNCGEELPNIS